MTPHTETPERAAELDQLAEALRKAHDAVGDVASMHEDELRGVLYMREPDQETRDAVRAVLRSLDAWKRASNAYLAALAPRR